jgi:predicted permease
MEVAGHVLGLFILILLGYAGKKLNIFNGTAAASFSVLLIKITLPCLIFVSFQQPFSRELLGEAGLVLGLSLLIYLVSFLVALVYPLLMGIRGRARGVHRFVIVFSNVGYIGYPLVQAVMGGEWLFHLSVFNMPFNLLCFSLGVWLISRGGEKVPELSWRIFLNPAVICTVLGFVFFIGSIRLPIPVFRSLTMAGNITSPLGMLIVGIILAGMDPRLILGRWRNYVTSLVRLIVMPLLVCLSLYAVGIRNPMLMLCALVSATPAAASAPALAGSYGGDAEEAGALVFLSTLLSLFTMPLVVYLAGLIA